MARGVTWTRQQLADLIKEGSSVLFKGRVIAQEDDLPTDSEILDAHTGVDREVVEEFATKSDPEPPKEPDPANPISHGEENVDPESGATISDVAAAALNAIATPTSKGSASAESTESAESAPASTTSTRTRSTSSGG